MNYYNLILSVQEYQIIKNLIHVEILDTEKNLLRTNENISPDFHRMLNNDKKVYAELMEKIMKVEVRSV